MSSGNPRRGRQFFTPKDSDHYHYLNYLKHIVQSRRESIIQRGPSVAQTLEELLDAPLSSLDEYECFFNRYGILNPDSPAVTPKYQNFPLTIEDIISMSYPIRGKQIVLSKPPNPSCSDEKYVNETANENLKQLTAREPLSNQNEFSVPKQNVDRSECVINRTSTKSESFINGSPKKTESVKWNISRKKKKKFKKRKDFDKGKPNPHNSNSTTSGDLNITGTEMPSRDMDTQSEVYKTESMPVINSLAQRKKAAANPDLPCFKMGRFSVGDQLDARKLNRLYDSYRADMDDLSLPDLNTLPNIPEERVRKDTTTRSLDELPDIHATSMGKSFNKVLPMISKEKAASNVFNRHVSEIPDLFATSLHKKGQYRLPRKPIKDVSYERISKMPEPHVTSLEKSEETWLPRKPEEDTMKDMRNDSVTDDDQSSVTSSEKSEENLLPRKPKEETVENLTKEPIIEMDQYSVTSSENSDEQLLPRKPNNQTLNVIPQLALNDVSEMSSEDDDDTVSPGIDECQCLNSTVKSRTTNLCELAMTSSKDRIQHENITNNKGNESIILLCVTSPRENEDKALPRIQHEHMTTNTANESISERSEYSVMSSKEDEYKALSRIQNESLTTNTANEPISEPSEYSVTSSKENEYKALSRIQNESLTTNTANERKAEKHDEQILPRIPNKQTTHGSGDSPSDEIPGTSEETQDKKGASTIQKGQVINEKSKIPIIKMSEIPGTSHKKNQKGSSRIQKGQVIYKISNIPIIEMSKQFNTFLNENTHNVLPSISKKRQGKLIKLSKQNTRTFGEKEMEMIQFSFPLPLIELHIETHLEEKRKRKMSTIQKDQSIKDKPKQPIGEISHEIQNIGCTDTCPMCLIFKKMEKKTFPKIQEDTEKPLMSEQSMKSLEVSGVKYRLPRIQNDETLKQPINEFPVTSQESDHKLSRVQSDKMVNRELKNPQSEMPDHFVTSLENKNHNSLPRLQNKQIRHTTKHPISESGISGLSSKESEKNTSQDSTSSYTASSSNGQTSDKSMMSSEYITDVSNQ